MSNEVGDPLQDPDVLHDIVREVIEHMKTIAPLLMKVLYPKGYAVGEIPEPDEFKELVDLIINHDAYLDIATGKAADKTPGYMQRGQQMLFREEELRQELLNAPTPA